MVDGILEHALDYRSALPRRVTQSECLPIMAFESSTFSSRLAQTLLLQIYPGWSYVYRSVDLHAAYISVLRPLLIEAGPSLSR